MTRLPCSTRPDAEVRPERVPQRTLPDALHHAPSGTLPASLFAYFLVAALLGLGACAGGEEDPLGMLDSELYDHPAGYCSIDAPLWSDLGDPHYQQIGNPVPNGVVPGVRERYPDYRTISKNLTVLESLQFLLSTVTNITSKLEDAQDLLEAETWQDAFGNQIPQMLGHCICTNSAVPEKNCDGPVIWAGVSNVVEELVQVENIQAFLLDFMDEHIAATGDELQAMQDDLDALLDPSSATNPPGPAINQAFRDAIDAAQAAHGGLSACGGFAAGSPAADLNDAMEEITIAGLVKLEELLDADRQALTQQVEALTGVSGQLSSLEEDVQSVIDAFDGVEGIQDLVKVNWSEIKDTVDDMVSLYEAMTANVQGVIADQNQLWANQAIFDARVAEVAEELRLEMQSRLGALQSGAVNASAYAACAAALGSAANFGGASVQSAWEEALESDLEQAILGTWEAARSRVTDAGDELDDLVAPALMAALQNQADTITGLIDEEFEDCYRRVIRPECFDFCDATDADDFTWFPADFLEDPAAAAGQAALFALEQTGWLDGVFDWVQTNLADDLGPLESVIGALGSIGDAIQAVMDFIAGIFGYVDRFTEGYHLGAYSELRPDLHMCIGYAGHGPFAQMAGLGGNRFSIGARYGSHNLSARNRVQYRSGGMAVSALGNELSLAPSLEINKQIHGWKLWDITRPFGIPANLPVGLGSGALAQYDVFNVIPNNQPFGSSGFAGAALIRDLYPARTSSEAMPDWPPREAYSCAPTIGGFGSCSLGSYFVQDSICPDGMPSCAPAQEISGNFCCTLSDDWRSFSSAVMSLGLNLRFDLPSLNEPKIRYEIADIPIIPGILTATPYIGFRMGVEWMHQTDYTLDRAMAMINENLPGIDQLGPEDFHRDMHTFQADDLSADNGTAIYVEPELGIDAFLGFKVWKIKVGAGASTGIAVNLRPGGHGGVIDFNAALAEALVNSNPPVDAPCEPVWGSDTNRACSNQDFEESRLDLSCDPGGRRGSCCISVVTGEGDDNRFRLCADAWTGIDEDICQTLDRVSGEAGRVVSILEQLPDNLYRVRNALIALAETVEWLAIIAQWNQDPCSERSCGEGIGQSILNTAGNIMAGISECATFGYCTLADGTEVHDQTESTCATGGLYRQVDLAGSHVCAITGAGQLGCTHGFIPEGGAPAGTFSQVHLATTYACALRTNGFPACWKFDSTFDVGQTDFPSTQMRELATAESFACGIELNGNLNCWGEIDATDVPEGTFTSMAGGFEHVCAIREDGIVVCFGAGLLDTPFGELPATEVTLSGGNGVCILDQDGEIDCALTPGSFGLPCSLSDYDNLPEGPFVQIEGQQTCSVCGRNASGDIRCGGLNPPTVNTSEFAIHMGALSVGQGLCIVTAAGMVECFGTDISVPAPREPGEFTAYTCRQKTEYEVESWQGSGCHPLQTGFPSACGCASNDHCGAAEVCNQNTGRCESTDGDEISCVCGAGGTCSAGRTCVSGACLTSCGDDSDCSPSLTCDDGFCRPPHNIPTAEEIVWGMANVEAPMHVVSSYAMSDFLATLLLPVELYVELSFKLFGKEREWRILDFQRAFDLGSLYKGWYQPGLEAFYQSECENALLDEPITNRFPRSLTSANGMMQNLIAQGVALTRTCPNGGVCRYPENLPASQPEPPLYTLGNAGTIGDFIAWCKEDMPQHVESPDPSDYSDLSGGILETFEFQEALIRDLYARNQICVNGVVWDEWLDALQPTFDANGNVEDPGIIATSDCRYDDPQTGISHVFPCLDTTEEMLRIWGCLDVTQNPFASMLATLYPNLVISDGSSSWLDIEEMFDPVFVNSQTFGAGLEYPYSPEAMKPQYRFAIFGPWFAVGQKWLLQVDACFDQRFYDIDENACPCNVDSDCDADFGERCNGGRCEQQLNGNWQPRECSPVYIDIQAGPCCGDGIVQNTATYSEECDGGPNCDEFCNWIDDTPEGACCAGNGVCWEDVGPEDCAGTFHAGTDCFHLDYCEVPEPDPRGACCTETGCLSDQLAIQCERLQGIWHEGQPCSDALCFDPTPTGACCTDDGCLPDIDLQKCEEAQGIWHEGQPCSDALCFDPAPTGACCTDDGCVPDIDLQKCEEAQGTWHEGQPCSDALCFDPAPTGACCTDTGCVPDVEERVCLELGGDWNQGAGCSADTCPDEPGSSSDEPGSSSDEPGSSSDEPGSSSDEPGSTSDEPGSSSDEPGSSSEGPQMGACCTDDGCVPDQLEIWCERMQGTWHPGRDCTPRLCALPVDEAPVDLAPAEPVPSGGCSSAGGSHLPLGVVPFMLGLLGLRMRSRPRR